MATRFPMDPATIDALRQVDPPEVEPSRMRNPMEEDEIPYERPMDLPPNMMEGPNGERLLKWKVEYSKGGAAQCRDLQCLFRVDNGGSRIIKKGELRIGRRILMEGFGSSSSEATVTMHWNHARCIFHQFLRARKTTRTIESSADIEFFENLEVEDQGLIERMINGSEDVRKAAKNTTSNSTTPEKVNPTGPGGRRNGVKRDYSQISIESGQRVWAHYRSGIERAKSLKPELAMIRSDEVHFDGTILLQFESNKTRVDREELYNNPRRKKLRGWNRVPRLFDGPKQRISRDWVDFKRNAPPLCGCNKQIPDHDCACSMSCSGKGGWGLVYGPDVENFTSHKDQVDALETLRKRLKESEARNVKEAQERAKAGDDSD